MRNKCVICLTRIIQRGSMITHRSDSCNHSANPGVRFKTVLRVHVANRAKSDIFVPAAEIVEIHLHFTLHVKAYKL